MKIKIHTAASEIDASIIKSVLENKGILASIGPGEGSLSYQWGSRGPNVPHDIFVNDDRTDDARKVLLESGFVPNRE